ncbi:MAG: prepilin-type N-terminal cleavage/methylation domain-containing protein [Planctomycetes bacterium]|nr:prepilin-type N-terminal cleavage/methylation domain-containing protein [Planctomycetota bacterium]
MIHDTSSHLAAGLAPRGASTHPRRGDLSPPAAPSARYAFTLIELLSVIAIIAALIGILMPSLSSAREVARGGKCLANLHAIGTAGAMYQRDYGGAFWPTVRFDYPTAGKKTYFWGTVGDPPDPTHSWLLNYTNDTLAIFDCPALKWGTYIPQAGMKAPTTTYGYNAWCLDPAFWGRTNAAGRPMSYKRDLDLRRPSDLFVFADSGLSWSPGGIVIFQNSTSLDPVTFPWGPNTTATNHFRHRDQTNALLADNHAAAFDPDGGSFTQPDQKLGFVGAENTPHYDQ